MELPVNNDASPLDSKHRRTPAGTTTGTSLRASRPSATFIFLFIFNFFPLAAMALAHWLHRKFGEVSVDQVLFHVAPTAHAQLQDIFAVEPSLAWSGVANVLLAPSLLAAILASAQSLLLRRPPHPLQVFIDRNRLAAFITGFGVMVGAGISLGSRIDMDTAWTADSRHDWLAEHYVPPTTVEVRASQARNLILIYLESMEQSYGDDRAFPRTLIPALTSLQREHGTLGRFVQVAGTQWTVAAMVASMCGIPLKGVGLVTRNRYSSVSQFLPGARCLSDILRANGYQTWFLQGAALRFAGKDRFLSQHGFLHVEGKAEIEHRLLMEHGAADNWRIRDDALFDIAKQRYAELLSGSQPFFLVVLSSDTHTARDAGHPSQFCLRRNVRTYGDLVRCTDELVATFVQSLRDMDEKKTTTIAILGDHLAMFGDPRDNEVFEALAHKLDRSPYHVLLDPHHAAPASIRHRVFTHYDLFPTLLSAAGFHVEGHRLGLGVDLFSDEATLAERYGESYLNLLGAQRASSGYLRLWFP